MGRINTGASRILVYRLGSLGDTLLALPVFHLIRRRFPAAHVTVLTNRPVQAKAPALADVLEGAGLIDEFIDYPVGLRDWRSLSQLRGKIAVRRFDLAVNLGAGWSFARSVRDHLFLRSCGIEQVIGTPWRRRDITCLPDAETGGHEWEAKRLARRVLPLGDAQLQRESSWDLGISVDETIAAKALLAPHGVDSGFIAFSLGTKADVKDWTQPNWLALMRALAARHPGIALVGIGASDDIPRTADCLAQWEGPTANLCGAASVRTTAAVLSSARLFIGHDSGPMHLAATVGVPCVAIFAARNLPGQWYPRGQRNTVLYHRTECFGCGLDVCLKYDKKCIRAIGVDDTLAAIEPYLN